MTVASTDVERFRVLVSERFGLAFDDSKLGFLDEVLSERLEAVGRPVDLYLAVHSLEPLERRALARRLTVPETYFFRDPDQLRALVAFVVRDSTQRTLRVLSAGCASGAEAYSIAMVLRDGLAPPVRPISVQAIDIHTGMLEQAAHGLYSPWALRQTPVEMRERWFREEGKGFRVDKSIRTMVSFEERNLVEDDAAFWRQDVFDVVFCRNVLMYFEPNAARAVVERIARSLQPGGLLFLGHAENLRGLSKSEFHLHHTHGTFCYERKGPADAYREAPVARPTPLSPTSSVEAVDLKDDSWVETIRRATDRIQVLGGRAARMTEPVKSPARAARTAPWDLGPALEHLGREQFSEARAVLATLPSESIADPDVLLLRAVLLAHGGDLVEAFSVCTQLLARDEMSAGAHYVMALCREADGDLEDAASHDRLAGHLDPGFAMPHLHLGRLARRAGDHAEARMELERALELLEREDAARVLLFGGGFRREALGALCRAELAACGGGS